MVVAVARHTGLEGASAGGAVAVARRTGLAELPHVPAGTSAHLKPFRRLARPSAGCTLQSHAIQEANSLVVVGCANLQTSQVRQNGHEGTGRDLGTPSVNRIFMQPEHILVTLQKIKHNDIM